MTTDDSEVETLRAKVAELILNLVVLPPDEPKDEQQALAARLHKQTDLGCVLVASAHIEDQLKQLIHAYFQRASKLMSLEIQAEALNETIEGERAFLQAFSVRTRFLYSIGLIPKHTKQTLDVFRRVVRNTFTHTISDSHTITGPLLERVLGKLDDDRRDVIASVSNAMGTSLMNPRNRFTFYAIMLWTELYRATKRLTEAP